MMSILRASDEVGVSPAFGDGLWCSHLLLRQPPAPVEDLLHWGTTGPLNIPGPPEPVWLSGKALGW